MKLYNEKVTKEIINQAPNGLDWRIEFRNKINALENPDKSRFILRYTKGEKNQKRFFLIFEEVLKEPLFNIPEASIKILETKRKSIPDKNGIDFILVFQNKNYVRSIGIQTKTSKNKNNKNKKIIFYNKVITFYRSDPSIPLVIVDTDNLKLKREIRLILRAFLIQIERDTKLNEITSLIFSQKKNNQQVSI